MKISIFLLCYNEELLLPYTLTYYKSKFPSAEIYLIDNNSTDNSRKIAEENGCKIKTFDTDNQQDESILINIRTHVWREFVTEGWIIVCDMDEWLDINEEQLRQEEEKGVTVIKTQGINIVGNSKTEDLIDIDIFSIRKGFLDDNFSKRVCFKVPEVQSMEYWYGAHSCFPQGIIRYSEHAYYLKHYNYLGFEYLVGKYKKRYERNSKSRLNGLNLHYITDIDNIVKIWQDCESKAIDISTA